MKCFSACRGVEREKCNTSMCNYISGKKNKYCKLSSAYYLEKTNVPGQCVTRKKNIASDANNISRKRIRKFMHNTATKNWREIFLKTICSNSGTCLAFGTHSDMIRKFFNGFTTFEFVDSPIKRIGTESVNGIINEVKYSKNGYDAYAILKSSITELADNLVYEYMVGQFLNKKGKQFPCFVETYGLYNYKTEQQWEHVLDTEIITANVMRDSLTHITTPPMDMLSEACTQSKLMAILIQHISKPQTIYQKLQIPVGFTNFVRNHLLYVLYQIYLPLSQLSGVYTHYDLHYDNVLLYKPANDMYIHYHYHLDAHKSIDFKSMYIAKLIDYGRGYFVDSKANPITKSKKIYTKLCKLAACKPDCGNNAGFGWLQSEHPPGSAYFIDLKKHNKSHDLRLLNMIKTEYGFEIEQNNPALFETLDKVVYDIYGTQELNKSGLPLKINNVNDACNIFQSMIERPEIIANHAQFYALPHFNKIGDLHIYCDGRPMQFKKTK